MKKMTCFNNPAFGQIRVIQADGKYLFCASDVAKSLGYKRPADAVTAHCKGSVIYRLPTAGGEQLAKLIPEGDVYRLIVHSKLPAAMEFERWVFDEVLPAIHRHGGYLGDSLARQIEQDPAVLYHFAEALVREKEKSERLEKDLLLLKPKADYFDAFVEPGDSTNIRATAKELDVPERLFCRFLQKEKYLYRAPAGNLMPYAEPFQRGLFIVRDFHYRHSARTGCYTLFTPKGKDELRSVCLRSEHGRNENVLPMKF